MTVDAYLEKATPFPWRRLEGGGNQMRSIRLDALAAILEEAYIRQLMTQALKVAGADLKKGRGEVVLKATLTPRRHAAR